MVPAEGGRTDLRLTTSSGFAVEGDAKAVWPLSLAVVPVHAGKLPGVDLAEVGTRQGCL